MLGEYMEQSILHIFPNEKFIEAFLCLLDNTSDHNKHFYLYLEGKDRSLHPIKNRENIIIIDSKLSLLKYIFKISSLIRCSDKIVIHGLYKWYLILFFYINKSVLNKSFWFIWGSDLYSHISLKRNPINLLFDYCKKKVISNIGHLVTYIEGDVALARKWYGAKGIYHNCLMYPSNLYTDYNVSKDKSDTINIQVGNSADPTNNHLEIFDKLASYKDDNIRLFVPLSYGDKVYAKKVIETGNMLFGNKLTALTDFMPFSQYLSLLCQIDIAIFAHKRQQGMGNIITLLGLGKKVYIRSDITPWVMFLNMDIKLYDIDDINITPIDNKNAQDNINIIKSHFTTETLLSQLHNIFNYGR